ncbi:MAG: hypothetical protein ABI983_09560, partial [Acidobacteriota bacterium]
FYAAGQSQIDNESFKQVHDLLREYDVRVMLAGDTHDFEHYKDEKPDEQPGAAVHYFVDGGGGAYLSIGTSLDWPAQPALGAYSFYPRTDAVTTKLESETPPWKWPAWWWAKRFGAWPFSVELLSAVFDFNRAPFFQSFIEVRVERSKQQVVFAVIGVDGPLRWRDVQSSAAEESAGQSLDAPVEFVVPMSPVAFAR